MNSTTHSLCCCCETRTHTHRRVTEMRCVVDRDRSPSTSVRWWAFRIGWMLVWGGCEKWKTALPCSLSLSVSLTHPHTRERITALQKGGKGGVRRLRRVRKMPMHLPEVAHVCFDSVSMRGWSGGRKAIGQGVCMGEIKTQHSWVCRLTVRGGQNCF